MRNSIRELIDKYIPNQGVRKYFSNTGWLFAGQMTRMLVALCVSVAVARYLGPKDFGLYSYIISVVALMTTAGQLGIQNIARRELITSPENKDTILGTCFTINAIYKNSSREFNNSWCAFSYGRDFFTDFIVSHFICLF